MTSFGFAPRASGGLRLIKLSMQRLWLTGQILPVGARLTVQHIFRSDEETPIEVIYSFALPRDAAMRSFRIRGEGFEAHSELRNTEAAVKLYEQGIAQGSLSSLVRQYGDGAVNLTVGNIRPKETVTIDVEILCGVELRDDGFRFRFPFTLSPSYHAQAKTALTAAGEGQMELPPDQFGDFLLPPFREDASALHQVGFDLLLSSQLPLLEIGSPSHAVRVTHTGERSTRVGMAIEKDVPDRDLVLDARFQSIEPQVLAANGHFAAIVPSSSFGVAPEVSRRLVVLLDRSGSMQGEPIAQACKAIAACLGRLRPTDRFGLVAFDDQVSVYQPDLVPATLEMRDGAERFLAQAVAHGGTALARGFLKAARLLGSEGGDVLILTDGQVSGTETILASARSTGVRLHCLGIGSASQDRFLALLARETGGVSRFVTPGERVDLPAVDLFAAIGGAVAKGLKTTGNIQPQPPSTVFSGTPVILYGAGEDYLELNWTGGELRLPIRSSATGIGDTLRLLQGSRLITDWESRYPGSDALAPLEKRKQNRVAEKLLELSRTYGLASREMSLVAVVTRPGDRPGELPETQVVPVGMPKFTALPGYFAATEFDFAELSTIGCGLASSASRVHGNSVVGISRRLESDGGMPGRNGTARALGSALALAAFLSQGHTPLAGGFQSHVQRLIAFLQSLSGLSNSHQRIVDAVVRAATSGIAPPGDWIALAENPATGWSKLEKAFLSGPGEKDKPDRVGLLWSFLKRTVHISGDRTSKDDVNPAKNRT